MQRLGLLILSAALVVGSIAASAQERFNSSEDAVTALVDAAKSEDQKALLKVLGPKGQQIVSSGDPVADRAAREKFVTAYGTKHSITRDSLDQATLVIGDNDWPFPIPLARKQTGMAVRHRGRARRDPPPPHRPERALRDSSHARLCPGAERICLARSGGLGPHVYAQRIVSSPGKKDGLYWPTAEGEEPSPLGDLAAQASAEGYKVGQKPIPYHGYYYRILKRQGASASGGAYDYVVNGKMIGGFALIAYPAEYGNSGIMTFMVNQDGTVFQKDLGERTEKIARRIETFDPDCKLAEGRRQAVKALATGG